MRRALKEIGFWLLIVTAWLAGCVLVTLIGTFIFDQVAIHESPVRTGILFISGMVWGFFVFIIGRELRFKWFGAKK